MKKPPVRHCDECFHFKPISGLICALGHKPRFVMPKATMRSIDGGAWGWRRSCKDFDMKGEK